MSPLGRLRLIAFVEGCSYLALLGVAMPLKYFAGMPQVDEQQVSSVEDLTPVIELYNTLISLGRYDEAVQLYYTRLGDQLHYRLGASRQAVELLELLFTDGLDELPRLSSRD